MNYVLLGIISVLSVCLFILYKRVQRNNLILLHLIESISGKPHKLIEQEENLTIDDTMGQV